MSKLLTLGFQSVSNHKMLMTNDQLNGKQKISKLEVLPGEGNNQFYRKSASLSLYKTS